MAISFELFMTSWYGSLMQMYIFLLSLCRDTFRMSYTAKRKWLATKSFGSSWIYAEYTSMRLRPANGASDNCLGRIRCESDERSTVECRDLKLLPPPLLSAFISRSLS